MTKHKTLIVYTSRKGQNYFEGKIHDLKIGNTAQVAQWISETCGIDLFEIETIKDYPLGYEECTEVSKHEKQTHARPQLKRNIDISSYDTIILGYPNWWSTAPMSIFTFLESQDFSSKTIIPFCTHEGTELGQSENDIKKSCPNSIVLKGLAIQGSKINESKMIIREWLKSNQLID